MVRSNLRVPVGRRAHIHLNRNPHGHAQSIIVKKYID